MPQTRRIRGEVAFPSDVTGGVAGSVTLELRDVSMQDQASTIVASKTMRNVALGANGRITFELDAPVVAQNRSLAMRVEVTMVPSPSGAGVNFLSTVSTPVSAAGEVDGLVVPVSRI